MKFQIILSIAVLVALTSPSQGLFLKTAIKKKVKAASALLPLVGGLASGGSASGGAASGGSEGEAAIEEEIPIEEELPIEEIAEEAEAPIRFVREYHTVPIYTYAPVYARPIYYRAVRPSARRSIGVTTNFGGVGRSIGNLFSGPARTIGSIGSNIRGAVGNALSASVPSGIEAYVSTY